MERRQSAAAIAVLFGFLVALLPSLALASAQEFDLERGKVKLEVPEDWETVSDLFGIPLMLLGPEIGGGRPVLTVTATGQDAAVFSDEKDLTGNQNDYREGRKQWLRKLGGKAVSFQPYRKIAWDGVTAAHVVGYRYRLKGVEYSESSYYVACKSKLYHVKSLLRASHEKNYAAVTDQAVRSFTCE